jgi:hypothetical protein
MYGRVLTVTGKTTSGKSHFFFELFAFSGFFGSILKLKTRFFPAKTTLTFLKIDPSFTTLGFINIAALEFVYKAGKKKWEFPDVLHYTSKPLDLIIRVTTWLYH